MKQCKRCHELKTLVEYNRDRTQSDGLDTWCKACLKEYRKEYRAKYPERIRASQQRDMQQRREAIAAYKQEWAQRNQERLSQKQKDYYQANKSRLNQRADAYYETNRTAILEQHRRYYAAHTEQSSAYQREAYQRHRVERLEAARRYREQNLAIVRARSVPITHARRARRAAEHRQAVSVENNFTLDQWLALCAHYGYCCVACREQKPLTVDHVIPLSRGGTNDISNIQPLCGRCNASKGTGTTDYRGQYNQNQAQP